jgi:hypothetical protein
MVTAVPKPNLGAWVDSEREALEEHYETTPNLVGIGAESGELRLRIHHDSENAVDARECVEGLQVDSVTVSRTEMPNAPEGVPNVMYNAVITGFAEMGEDARLEPFHTNKTYYHAYPALAWIEENVPDFDLYPVVVFEGDELVEDAALCDDRQYDSVSKFWS